MIDTAPEMTVAAGLLVLIVFGIVIAMWWDGRRRRREAARWQTGRISSDNPHVSASRKVH